jgi:hypothetical protein
MKAVTPVLAERLKSLPLTEAERVEAIQWIESGAVLADTMLAVAHFFHREPDLKHAAH